MLPHRPMAIDSINLIDFPSSPRALISINFYIDADARKSERKEETKAGSSHRPRSACHGALKNTKSAPIKKSPS
jgi:hypothetical protein